MRGFREMTKPYVEFFASQSIRTIFRNRALAVSGLANS